jgi:SAM-dependent methyltransferase
MSGATQPSPNNAARLAAALWRLYRRPEKPTAWENDGNLPWNDPAFSERMLHEHLDESHSAASRTLAERTHQIEWLWSHLNLRPGSRVLDLTCGPGLYAVALAARGCQVTGVDFSPASVRYAREQALQHGVAVDPAPLSNTIYAPCRSRQPPTTLHCFSTASFAVFARHEAQALLHLAADSPAPRWGALRRIARSGEGR